MPLNQHHLDQYRHSAQRAVTWLTNQLNSDGSYRLSTQELACYYKSPYLFFLSGKGQESYRVLHYIRREFMRPNGDFSTSPELKSHNSAFIEYWAYMNGWIAMATQKMGRFDLAYPAYHYLQAFYHPVQGGFITRQPYGQGDNSMDMFTTAHLGLVSLYFGNLPWATTAGDLLQRFLSLQPTPKKECLLRMDTHGKLISTFPQDQAIFFTVSLTQPDQAYFMMGYPIAFLGKLYAATGQTRFLETAKEYLDRLMAGTGNLRAFHFSHKVAWGAAILARLTEDARYVELTQDILEHLLGIQGLHGAWLQDQPVYMQFDQTAEIAIWLMEIVQIGRAHV